MKKIAIGILAVVVIVVVAVVYWGTQSPQPAGNSSPSDSGASRPEPSTGGSNNQATTADRANNQAAEPAPTQPTEPKQPAAPIQAYCANGHDKNETTALNEAGGLVGIFQKEAALADAYGCAESYLTHGGDIDAADPRADSEHLTPLLFAIKRNDPKMVRFMIAHGADLQQRGGTKDIKPYGYAVFSALQNRSTDYNEVIGIIDQSLDKDTDSTASNP